MAFPAALRPGRLWSIPQGIEFKISEYDHI